MARGMVVKSPGASIMVELSSPADRAKENTPHVINAFRVMGSSM